MTDFSFYDGQDFSVKVFGQEFGNLHPQSMEFKPMIRFIEKMLEPLVIFRVGAINQLLEAKMQPEHKIAYTKSFRAQETADAIVLKQGNVLGICNADCPLFCGSLSNGSLFALHCGLKNMIPEQGQNIFTALALYLRENKLKIKEGFFGAGIGVCCYGFYEQVADDLVSKFFNNQYIAKRIAFHGPRRGQRSVDLTLIARICMREYLTGLFTGNVYFDPRCTACFPTTKGRKYWSHVYDSNSDDDTNNINKRNLTIISRNIL